VHIANYGTDASGNQTSCSIAATVQTGSFTIAADPDWLDVQAGAETGDLSRVSLSGIGSFAGNVTVTVTSITDANGNDVTANGGIDCWFTSSGDTTSNPLAAGGTDTLNAIAGYDTPEGDYWITLTAADGSGNTSATTLDLEVDAGFELYAEPTSLTIPTGGTGTSIISAGSFGSPYGSRISLEQPQIFDMNGNQVIDGSVGVTLSQSSINVDDGSTSTATVTVGADVLAGSTYMVFITGSGPGGSESSAQISVTVGSPSFKINPAPAAVSINAGDPAGTTSVMSVMPADGFTGTVGLSVTSTAGTDASGNPIAGPMPSATFAPASVPITDTNGQNIIATIVAGSDVQAGMYTVTILGRCGSLSSPATITVTVNATGTPTMSIGNASWSPNPADVGDTISGTVPATITPSQTGTVTYSWIVGQVWRSDDGTPGTFAPYSGNCIIGWPSGTNNSNPTFNAQFFETGYYIVQVGASARITNDGTGTLTFSAHGYIGGVESDIKGATAAAYTFNPMQSSVSSRMHVIGRVMAFCHDDDGLFFIHGQGPVDEASAFNKYVHEIWGYEPLQGSDGLQVNPKVGQMEAALNYTIDGRKPLTTVMFAGHGTDGSIICLKGPDPSTGPGSQVLLTYSGYTNPVFQNQSRFLIDTMVSDLSNIELVVLCACTFGGTGATPPLAQAFLNKGVKCVVCIGVEEQYGYVALEFLTGTSKHPHDGFIELSKKLKSFVAACKQAEKTTRLDVGGDYKISADAYW